MDIRPAPEWRDFLLAPYRARETTESLHRQTEIHVSDLVYCLRKAWSEKASGVVKLPDDDTILQWIRGLSHEALLVQGFTQVRSGYCFSCNERFPWDARLEYTRACPECNEPLLVGTIDCVVVEDPEAEGTEGFIPLEIKSTLKSSNTSIEDLQHYFDQLLSYMAIMGCPRGILVVLHIMGSYGRRSPNLRSSGPKPELKTYEIEATREELDNWLKQLRERFSIMLSDSMPEANPYHTWICNYCEVGERLPDGTICSLWPWEKDGDIYVKKGSKSISPAQTLQDLAILKQKGESDAEEAG